MKITPTMKREHRNSGFSSPVFHPKRWPPWSDTPYHRDGAAALKKVFLPRGFVDMGEEPDYAEWEAKQRKYWQHVANVAPHGVYIKIEKG